MTPAFYSYVSDGKGESITKERNTFFFFFLHFVPFYKHNSHQPFTISLFAVAISFSVIPQIIAEITIYVFLSIKHSGYFCFFENIEKLAVNILQIISGITKCWNSSISQFPPKDFLWDPFVATPFESPLKKPVGLIKNLLKTLYCIQRDPFGYFKFDKNNYKIPIWINQTLWKSYQFGWIPSHIH